jgi:shikimate dehydrogenase
VISGATRVAGVIGDPVRHSLSPVLHNAAYRELGIDWVYVAFPVPAGQAREALAAMRVFDIAGLSVTMPHKADIAAACDHVTPDAAQLQSVNTVTLRADGSFFGESTDGEGFLRSLHAAGHDPNGARVLLLGAGGAARAVGLALLRAGASVAVAARRPDAAAAVPHTTRIDWDARTDASRTVDVIVNATPIGMGDDPSLVLEPPANVIVADLVYHPLETPLLRAARANGCATVDGLGMLVQQAALQVERWTDCPAPIAAMRAAVEQTLS